MDHNDKVLIENRIIKINTKIIKIRWLNILSNQIEGGEEDE